MNKWRRWKLEIGKTGELFISGEQVVSGYLNRVKETDSSFITNRFLPAEGVVSGAGKLYKTGDMVRYLSDGNIEFIGRKDNQIKLRGYRIELGEIESILENLDGIKQAVVLLQEDNYQNKLLVAYIIHDTSVSNIEKESEVRL